MRYNRGIKSRKHSIDDYVMLYQKDIEKLKLRWRGPFMISNYEDHHDVSFTLTQLDERDVKRIFHDDHLKSFQPRYEYLVVNDIIDDSDAAYQIIRQSRRVKRVS